MGIGAMVDVDSGKNVGISRLYRIVELIDLVKAGK
jgi:hypothetical protein